MAAASESEIEEDTFLGFVKEDQAAVAEWRQARLEARNQSDSELDISVSSVAREVLSDLSDTEEEEKTCNANANPVEVLPFTAATGPTSGVAEDGTLIDFFYLMYPEELIVARVICRTPNAKCTTPNAERETCSFGFSRSAVNMAAKEIIYMSDN